jgi:predicted DNA-binding ribbon-helix-helix protein
MGYLIKNTYRTRMTKRKLTLTINEDLLGKARYNDINLSSFLEIELRRYLALIQGKSLSVLKKEQECGRRDLNPSFKLGKLK